MYLSSYQDKASRTAIYPGTGTITGLSYVSLGLGEVGEFQGKVKKIIRDKKGIISDEDRLELAKELGDILWYVAMAAEELDYCLNAIASMNLEKLESRMQRDVISGSGDNR